MQLHYRAAAMGPIVGTSLYAGLAATSFRGASAFFYGAFLGLPFALGFFLSVALAQLFAKTDTGKPAMIAFCLVASCSYALTYNIINGALEPWGKTRLDTTALIGYAVHLALSLGISLFAMLCFEHLPDEENPFAR